MIKFLSVNQALFSHHNCLNTASDVYVEYGKNQQRVHMW